MFRLIEVGPARAHLSPAFGNCNEPTVALHADHIELRFDAEDADVTGRTPVIYRYRHRILRALPVSR